jgi:hypothetical protein
VGVGVGVGVRVCVLCCAVLRIYALLLLRGIEHVTYKTEICKTHFAKETCDYG